METKGLVPRGSKSFCFDFKWQRRYFRQLPGSIYWRVIASMSQYLFFIVVYLDSIDITAYLNRGTLIQNIKYGAIFLT